MSFEIAFLLSALICVFITAMFGVAFYYKRRAFRSWLSLRALYKERFGILNEAHTIASLTYAADSETIVLLTAALYTADYAAEPAEYETASKALAIEYAKLNAVIKKYPLLYEKERYSSLTQLIIVNEEKIAFAKQFYNEEVKLYNAKAFAYPVRAASVIFGFKRLKPL